MSRFAFRNWLSQEGNQLFWQQPLASEKMDSIIIDHKMQKSIAGSNKNQALYSYIENYIVTSYAQLIDYKLREVYQGLSLDEFKEPSGFERREKASAMQLNYFQLREQLEFFLKNDIQRHRDNPDAELNAFRRWIEIANILLKRHCYEGFMLISVNMQLIARPDLINGLPHCIRENYNQFCEMNKPDGNHRALRRYIKLHQNEADFSPMIFNYHAIAMLNESIEGLRGQELLLKHQNKQLATQINKIKKTIKESYGKETIIQELQEQRVEIAKNLKKIKLALASRFQQRDDLLVGVAKEQKQPLKSLPSHVDQTYQRVKDRFDKQKENDDMLDSNSSLKRNGSSSKLYSHKLLPSLWKRKGVTEDNYWGLIFTPSCLKNK
ncbi:hypothetical protein [Legionella fallonii]|uniref:Ras-GEF domain-containing protein n=1 Tax=Legionella fallonii LLAP-10 TaxID=1212491 RepID=A0A098G3Q5_9GAMM|nr:hypothetical protein [Legionella fallonii]CEG57103.1 conserved protein of unknown function [Legionella fallonii LLAP-10]